MMAGNALQAPARGRPIVFLASAVIAFVVLVALGTWQVERLAWKEGLIATIAERMASTPVPLSDAEARFAAERDVDYVPVTVSGRFDHAHERHFFATWQGQSGWFVYTPLILPDDRVLLVNRGFVPYDRKDAATRAEGQVEGTVSITGLARNPLAGKPSSMLPDNDPEKNIYYWKDFGAMAAAGGHSDRARLVPFFVDANADPVPGGMPLGGVTLVDLPNNHLQYAVTWYGLALVLLVISVVWLLRHRRGG